MKKLMQIGSVVLAALTVIACGSDKKDSGAVVPAPAVNPMTQNAMPYQGQQMCLNKNLPGNYFYQFRDGIAGCSTGRQVFTTLQDKCNALMDDARNNNCAKQFRINQYNAECVCNATAVSMQNQIPLVAGNINSNYRPIVCSISGADLSGGFLSGFKNRDNQKTFTWNSKKKDSFSLPFGLTNRYGSAKLTLIPADQGRQVHAKLTLAQDEGRRIYSAEADFDNNIRLAIDDQDQQISVTLDCVAQDLAMRNQVAVKAISKVVCANHLNSRQDTKTTIRPEAWDGKSRKDIELNMETSIESFVAQLLPGMGQTAAAVELQGQGIDLNKQIRVKGSLSSTVKLGFEDKNADYSLQMDCSAE